MKQLLTEDLILASEEGVILSSLKLRTRHASYPNPKPSGKAERENSTGLERSQEPSALRNHWKPSPSRGHSLCSVPDENQSPPQKTSHSPGPQGPAWPAPRDTRALRLSVQAPRACPLAAPTSAEPLTLTRGPSSPLQFLLFFQISAQESLPQGRAPDACES